MSHSVQIGCDFGSSLAAIELARKYPNWYATVGYHPVDAQSPELSKNRAGGKEIHKGGLDAYGEISGPISDRGTRESELRSLILEHRDIVVAIGETGLDQHYLSDDISERSRQLEEQCYWFERQANMAKEYQLPLIIHTRDARLETIAAIKKFDITYAVIHCFSEDFAFAQKLMEFSSDIYFSFSGIITYKSAPDIQEAARQIPLDRILIETDAPFLSPIPHRGGINEPAHTKYVLQKIQELRSEDPEYIEKIIFENSLRFYQLAK